MNTVPVTAETMADKIRALIASAPNMGQRKRGELKLLMGRMHFADLADVFENHLKPEETLLCFEYLPLAHAGQVLISLPEAMQHQCLQSLPPAKASKLLQSIAADDAVDILQTLNTSDRYRLMGEMPFDGGTRNVHQLLVAQPNTAEGIMTTDFIKIPLSQNQTIASALELIRQAEDKCFIYYLYLITDEGSLHGVVSLKTLLLHSPETPLKDVSVTDVKSVHMGFDQALVANLFRKYYNLLAVPVVDNHDVLRGIVTLDDVLDVIDEESSTDYYQSTGIFLPANLDESNLLSGPIAATVKARLPWLMVTMLGQLIAAGIISHYQHTVSQAVITFSFMPLISGLSGNIGTQSDTIAVRGLALNLINTHNIRAKWLRELRIALVMGLSLGLMTGTASWLQYHHWPLSLLLLVSIVVLLCVSASLGVLTPYAVERYLKRDPAGVGGPLITTLLDVTAFASYLWVMQSFTQAMI